jgi:hypothetical protein
MLLTRSKKLCITKNNNNHLTIASSLAFNLE